MCTLLHSRGLFMLPLCSLCCDDNCSRKLRNWNNEFVFFFLIFGFSKSRTKEKWRFWLSYQRSTFNFFYSGSVQLHTFSTLPACNFFNVRTFNFSMANFLPSNASNFNSISHLLFNFVNEQLSTSSSYHFINFFIFQPFKFSTFSTLSFSTFLDCQFFSAFNFVKVQPLLFNFQLFQRHQWSTCISILNNSFISQLN